MSLETFCSGRVKYECTIKKISNPNFITTRKPRVWSWLYLSTRFQWFASLRQKKLDQKELLLCNWIFQFLRSKIRSTMSTFSGDETAPFFGFLGAAAALVFSCKFSISVYRSGSICYGSNFHFRRTICRHGGSVRNSQKWRRSGVYGCDETGVGDEIHCSGGYGWCVGYLWIDYCRYHQYWY